MGDQLTPESCDGDSMGIVAVSLNASLEASQMEGKCMSARAEPFVKDCLIKYKDSFEATLTYLLASENGTACDKFVTGLLELVTEQNSTSPDLPKPTAEQLIEINAALEPLATALGQDYMDTLEKYNVTLLDIMHLGSKNLTEAIMSGVAPICVGQVSAAGIGQGLPVELVSLVAQALSGDAVAFAALLEQQISEHYVPECVEDMMEDWVESGLSASIATALPSFLNESASANETAELISNLLFSTCSNSSGLSDDLLPLLTSVITGEIMINDTESITSQLRPVYKDACTSGVFVPSTTEETYAWTNFTSRLENGTGVDNATDFALPWCAANTTCLENLNTAIAATQACFLSYVNNSTTAIGGFFTCQYNTSMTLTTKLAGLNSTLLSCMMEETEPIQNFFMYLEANITKCATEQAMADQIVLAGAELKKDMIMSLRFEILQILGVPGAREQGQFASVFDLSKLAPGGSFLKSDLHDFEGSLPRLEAACNEADFPIITSAPTSSPTATTTRAPTTSSEIASSSILLPTFATTLIALFVSFL